MTERIILLFLLMSSLIYLSSAQELTFGTLGSPKSGFLPNLAGITALLLSLALLFRQLRFSKAIKQDPVNWTRFLFFIIGLVFYIMILNIVGYFVATFIFLFYLFKITDTAGWAFPLAISCCSSVVCYLLFSYYLKVTLP